MREKLEKNRVLILAMTALVALVTSFPSMWSVFQVPVAEYTGVTLAESANVFPLCPGFFGLFYIISGKLMEKIPERVIAIIGTVLICISHLNMLLLSGGCSALVLYIAFPFFFGAGCGFLYPAVIVPLNRWYAEKTGFATGTSTAIGALMFVGLTFVAKLLLNNFGLRVAFIFMACLTAVIGFTASTFCVSPTDEYIAQKVAGATTASGEGKKQIRDFKSGEMLKTKQFYLLYLGAILVFPAYSVMVSSIVSLATSRGIPESLAVTAVALSSGINSRANFLVPSLSDKLGRKTCIIGLLSLTLASYVILLNSYSVVILVAYIVLFVSHMCWQVLLIPFSIDMYGFKYSAANNGITSSYTTVCSLILPTVTALFTTMFGDNANAIIGVGGLVLGIVMIILINPKNVKLKENK